MRTSIVLTTALAAATLALPGSANAAAVVYFGENTDPDGEVTGDPVDARADFLAQLTAAVSTESFESFANRSQPTSLTFSGSNGAITADLDAVDGDVRNSSRFGRFATDGTNYYDTGSNFTIDFNSPIAAFGFYGTDFGDFPGQVTVSLLRDGFDDEQLLVPSSVNAPNASLLFFGAIDSANPFTSIRFSTTSGEDIIGLDQLTIGDVNQVAGAVPEPSTWALLLLGFAFVGGTMRARRRQTMATLSYS